MTLWMDNPLLIIGGIPGAKAALVDEVWDVLSRQLFMLFMVDGMTWVCGFLAVDG